MFAMKLTPFFFSSMIKDFFLLFHTLELSSILFFVSSTTKLSFDLKNKVTSQKSNGLLSSQAQITLDPLISIEGGFLFFLFHFLNIVFFLILINVQFPFGTNIKKTVIFQTSTKLKFILMKQMNKKLQFFYILSKI